MNAEQEKKNDEILGIVTEFGRKLAATPEVRLAISSDAPIWERLIISDLVLAFEEALRAEIPVIIRETNEAQVPAVPVPVEDIGQS